jgi:hypothetical protein
MGADRYYFRSISGKGRIVETIYDEAEGRYIFLKSLLTSDGNGGYDGKEDMTDGDVDDNEPYIVVIFDGPILKTKIDCIGPYEIEDHFVSIKTDIHNNILISRTFGP